MPIGCLTLQYYIGTMTAFGPMKTGSEKFNGIFFFKYLNEKLQIFSPIFFVSVQLCLFCSYLLYLVHQLIYLTTFVCLFNFFTD